MNNFLQDGAGYIRVSSHMQTELSPDAQKRLILDYAKAHDILISPDHIFIDTAISGREAENRPAFQQMIAMAKSSEHPFSVILLWKFSRFARNQEEAIVYKSILKKQCKVDVISISEPLVEGPFNSLIERIIEWMDEYYSINLSEEVKRGMTENALRGRYQATPPYGYKSLNHNQPLVVVPDEAEIVKYIFEQYAAGKSFSRIARDLNQRGLKTKRGNPFNADHNIKCILQNRFYIGKVSWNGIERDGQHETFISDELFQTVNERIKDNQASATSPATQNPHWLSGIVKCSVCGKNLSYSVPKRKRSGGPFFQCWKYAKGIHSESSHISEKFLVEGVLTYLDSLLNGADFSFSYRTTSQQKLEDTSTLALYEKEIKKLDFREIRIHEAYEAGIDTIEEYRQNKEHIQSERERLTRIINMQSEMQQRDPAEDKKEMLNQIQTVYNVISDATVGNDVKREFIQSILEKIVWNRQENTLSFYLQMPENP